MNDDVLKFFPQSLTDSHLLILTNLYHQRVVFKLIGVGDGELDFKQARVSGLRFTPNEKYCLCNIVLLYLK